MSRGLVLAILVVAGLQVSPVYSESGIATRPSNPTCLAPQRPEAGSMTVVPAFSSISRGDGIAIGHPPGDSSYVFLLDRAGILFRFPNEATATTKTTVLDIRALFDGTSPEGQSGMMSMAFHPDFSATGEVYVSYMVPGSTPTSYVARYTSTDGGRTFAPDGEVLMALPQQGALNGVGKLLFGRDGYLYVAFGDGGARRRVQDSDTWYGKILRIDVDHGSPYAIPPDNPFAAGGGAPEVYAGGLRNPWSFAQDAVSGAIWVSDVGESSWEEVNKLVNGGNYGWPITEGFHCFQADTCDRTGLIDPIHEYSHDEGCAIIGGHVYRGSLFPSLTGKYVFGDYCSGQISSLEETPQGPVVTPLVGSGLAIRSISEAHDHELLLIASGDNRIRKLVPDTSGGNDNFPALLSETGCVDPADPTSVADGVIPYEVNAQLWSDGAAKRRWMAIPDGTQIAVGADGDFDFPIGSVLVKEFAVEQTPFETRLLVRHDDGGWAGYTYRWNDTLTDAELVPPGGLADQEIGPLLWSYPSRAQCLDCHSAAAGRTLGLETAQLNRSIQYPSGTVANQLETLRSIGMFANDPGGTPDRLPALAALDDQDRSLDHRARSYLHANCSGCHRPDGPAQSLMDLRYQVAFEHTATCNADPQVGNLGVPGAKILVPGSPAASILSLRMHALDGNRMPPLGTRLVHQQGTAVIDDWIGNLRGCIDPVPRKAPGCADGPLPVLCTLPDLDADGTADLAAVRAGPTHAELREGAAGTLIRTLPFLSTAFTPAAAAVLPDTDANGVAELAILAAREADSRMVVQIRNLDGSGTARQVWFATGHTPIAIALIPRDADANGVPELAVLSTRNSDGRGVVEIRNVAGDASTTTLWVPAGFEPQDLEILPDADGNGVPDVAVLATRSSDGRILVQVRNADGADPRYSSWFSSGQTAIDLAVVPDKESDGIPELAVLSSRTVDGRLLVEVRNASGPPSPSSFWLAPGYTGVALEPLTPVYGNTIPEIAVLAQRQSDGRILVSVRNAAGPGVARSIWYSAGHAARNLMILDDVDHNGIEETAVLMTRNSDGRILVQSRNAFGSPAPRNYLFAP